MRPELQAMRQKSEKLSGSSWLVPSDLYEPIRQQSVLLMRAKDSLGSKAFIEFLKNHWAKKLLVERFGYGVEDFTAMK